MPRQDGEMQKIKNKKKKSNQINAPLIFMHVATYGRVSVLDIAIRDRRI